MGVLINKESSVLAPAGLANWQEHWDARFLSIAKQVASWSKDPSTKCGAVIVRTDKTIASVGYNGFPRGCSDSPHLYANREEKYGRVVHAEVNAILSAREPLHGYTLYTWPAASAPSCDRCTTCIIQAGIARVVHCADDASEFSGRWADAMTRSLQLYHEAAVNVVSYNLKADH